MGTDWSGRRIELMLGNPAHGGFCVARHDGRVVFVRHGLPGERVFALVTEDRGGSYCFADTVEVLQPSEDRVDPACPISGPGGAGCCDLSHASMPAQRRIGAAVVAEQLRRLGGVERDVVVEDLPGGAPNGTKWRTRVRLAVDVAGNPGYRRYRSNDVVPELACPQIEVRAYLGLADRVWQPGSELQVVLDDAGARHVVEIAPPSVSRTGHRSAGRRGASARRAAANAPRAEKVIEGSGRTLERVGSREWYVTTTGFWQAHRGAPETYSAVVAQWADAAPGSTVWDLYGGAGVFAAALAEQVGPSGRVEVVESARSAVDDGMEALADLPQVHFRHGRVELLIGDLPAPQIVVLDPPRAGAGKDVVAAIAAAGPRRVIHVGCDPAAFGRDVGLYRGHGYQLADLRTFAAFPSTHHVECLGLFTR
ncbi:class I SAM-dependent RNA methyltransferase [Rhodococcus chondri]|uniref:TRAM domain-containing protein n=1 Tax=Rhodococcus chondri TaxID=3065941 RepID=A0ABU7JRA5_9NOCA|nr:TRAM domain-containing protein [Rhodococcus sp. CC-R104]MEE2032424.1 TRAM domain-containing protein [Rhodococcus sp. CC-R104]